MDEQKQIEVKQKGMSSDGPPAQSETPIQWEMKFKELKQKSIAFAQGSSSKRLALEQELQELKNSLTKKNLSLLEIKTKTKSFVLEQKAKREELEGRVSSISGERDSSLKKAGELEADFAKLLQDSVSSKQQVAEAAESMKSYAAKSSALDEALKNLDMEKKMTTEARFTLDIKAAQLKKLNEENIEERRKCAELSKKLVEKSSEIGVLRNLVEKEKQHEDKPVEEEVEVEVKETPTPTPDNDNDNDNDNNNNSTELTSQLLHQNESLNSQIAALQSSSTSLESALSAKDSLLSELQASLTSKLSSVAELSNKSKLLEVSSSSLSARLLASSEAQAASASRAASLSREVADLRGKVSDVEGRETAHIARLNEANKREGRARVELEELRATAEGERERSEKREVELDRERGKGKELERKLEEERTVGAEMKGKVRSGMRTEQRHEKVQNKT